MHTWNISQTRSMNKQPAGLEGITPLWPCLQRTRRTVQPWAIPNPASATSDRLSSPHLKHSACSEAYCRRLLDYGRTWLYSWSRAKRLLGIHRVVVIDSSAQLYVGICVLYTPPSTPMLRPGNKACSDQPLRRLGNITSYVGSICSNFLRIIGLRSHSTHPLPYFHVQHKSF